MSATMPTMARTQVACVDDDMPIRKVMPHLLPDADVVGTFSRVEHFLQRRPAADVVLLDLHLRGPEDDVNVTTQGMRAVRAVSTAGYRALIYTNEPRRGVQAACLAAGAHGLVLKTASEHVLREAVAAVASGGSVIPVSLVGLVEKYSRQGRLGQLSPRQTEVLRSRARGEAYKSIARRLDIDARTVEHHMYEVTGRFKDFMRTHSPADLERELGIGVGDLLDPGPAMSEESTA